MAAAALQAVYLGRQIRRRIKVSMHAAGRVVRPPLPPWSRVIDVTPQRDPPPPPKIQVHPVQLELENALRFDSLRVLCQVLSKASGKIHPARDNPDRTKRPILNTPLAIRSLLRFVELRHGATDDLTPADISGTCGAGINVLLKKCRKDSSEVLRAFETRVDDVVRMIRAFYDLRDILGKNMPLFRTLIERGIPAILQRRGVLLPRMISYLEPYGDLQLTFMYEAARLGIFRKRLPELETTQLLEVTGSWATKAQKGEIAVIVANKVRSTVREVALLQLPLTAAQRTDWVAASLWASTQETSPEVQRLVEKVREGMIQRRDPGELFSMSITLLAEDIRTPDVHELISLHLREAFQAASPQRTLQVLGEVNPRPSMNYPKALREALAEASSIFAAKAPVEQIEGLLSIWARRRFSLLQCPNAVAQALASRGFVDSQPGPCAVCGKHLCTLGVDNESLAPLLIWFLGPKGATIAAGEEEATSNMQDAFSLLADLWEQQGGQFLRLAKVEAIMQLIGLPGDTIRQVDTAANSILKNLATQFVGIESQAEQTLEGWRKDAGRIRLATIVVPMILEAANTRPGTTPVDDELIDASSGDVLRSVLLLGQALRQEALSLRHVEWALSPGACAEPEVIKPLILLVSQAASAGGIPEKVMRNAAAMWLADGAKPAHLAVHVAGSAIAAWEEEGTTGAGIDTLRETRNWLEVQLAEAEIDPTAVDGRIAVGPGALKELETLLMALDGSAPAFSDLNRARDGLLSRLTAAGEAALTDAVSNAWSAAVPGVRTGPAASHFGLWWKRAENQRNMVESLVAGAVDELRWRTQLRTQATFTGTTPIGGQSPAWRVEDFRRVPWFVPEDAVADAYGADTSAPHSGRSVKVDRRSPLSNATVIEKAKDVTGGRCMYCGSSNDLRARFVWPLELGGQNLESNLAAACPLCVEMMEHLGSKRWGEVLAAEPADAATVWWEAQKKANMKSMGFLQTKVSQGPIDMAS